MEAMQTKGKVEDVFCPECEKVRVCEIIGLSKWRGGGVSEIRYLCSSEHRFPVAIRNPRKAMWPRKRLVRAIDEARGDHNAVR